MNNATKQPIAALGSGELVSHLMRISKSGGQADYRFNLFRIDPESGMPTSWLEIDELWDLVKLCQVLSFAMIDDGWVEASDRDKLVQLNTDLDRLTGRWEE